MLLIDQLTRIWNFLTNPNYANWRTWRRITKSGIKSLFRSSYSNAYWVDEGGILMTVTVEFQVCEPPYFVTLFTDTFFLWTGKMSWHHFFNEKCVLPWWRHQSQYVLSTDWFSRCTSGGSNTTWLVFFVMETILSAAPVSPVWIISSSVS